MARVLIVDDSLMIRRVLRDILTDGGHEVVGEAPDGATAERRVRTLAPEVVTLDLVMPVRTGLATLPTLLEIDPFLTVVVCSASADQNKVLKAIRLGAAGFIAKPITRESVLSGIEEATVRGQNGLGLRRTMVPTSPAPAPAELVVSPQPSRRAFPRVSSALRIRVTPPEGPPIITTTIDLGGGGALLSPVRLAPNTQVAFRLELGQSEAPIEGHATVSRVDGAGRPALSFDRVSVGDRDRLLSRLHSLSA